MIRGDPEYQKLFHAQKTWKFFHGFDTVPYKAQPRCLAYVSGLYYKAPKTGPCLPLARRGLGFKCLSI